MANIESNSEQFTGLILLTAEDRPGIAAQLFQTLAPFAVSVIDMGQIVIRNRVILTVLITLNPAHQSAIEEDLQACASNNDVDIATVFSHHLILNQDRQQTTLNIRSEKLHPASMELISSAILDLGGNIESMRKHSSEENTFVMIVSGVDEKRLGIAMTEIDFQDQTNVVSGA